MASIDSVWGRLFAAPSARAEEPARRRDATPRVWTDSAHHAARPEGKVLETGGRGAAAGRCTLRAFANEDVLFYVKRIDNSGVVRQADPNSRARCLRMAGSVFGAAVLLIFVLLPSAYGLLAGYRIQSLRHESERLAAAQASLELEETQLLSPARMEELAREQRFVDPAPQNVVYLDEKQGSLAMNQ